MRVTPALLDKPVKTLMGQKKFRTKKGLQLALPLSFESHTLTENIFDYILEHHNCNFSPLRILQSLPPFQVS